MRMAKMQKATLDPSKISGYCGRLKCCLRYEDKSYTELKKRLPRKGTRVKIDNVFGKVINSQILTQLVIVGCEDGKKVAVPLEELEIVTQPADAEKKPKVASNKQAKPKEQKEPKEPNKPEEQKEAKEQENEKDKDQQ